MWITTTILPAHKQGRCTVIKCLRRGLVFSLGESNGCYCRGFLLFQVSRKIRTILLDHVVEPLVSLWISSSSISADSFDIPSPVFGSQWISIVKARNHIKVVFFFLKYDKVAFKSRGVRSQRAKVARNSKKSVGEGEGESCSRTRADIGIYCQYWQYLTAKCKKIAFEKKLALSILTNKLILFS